MIDLALMVLQQLVDGSAKFDYGLLARTVVDAQDVEHGRPAFDVVHRATTPLHPAPFAAGMPEAELDRVVFVRRDGTGHCARELWLVGRMHERTETVGLAAEGAGFQSEDLLQLAAPPHAIG